MAAATTQDAITPAQAKTTFGQLTDVLGLDATASPDDVVAAVKEVIGALDPAASPADQQEARRLGLTVRELMTCRQSGGSPEDYARLKKQFGR